MKHPETVYIPPLNEPPIGLNKSVQYNGQRVNAKAFLMRSYTNVEEYIMIEPPNTRPYTRVSIFKNGKN